jgi:hypothetical protein
MKHQRPYPFPMNHRTRHTPGFLFTRRRGNAAFGLLALLIVAAIILYLMFGMGGKGSSTAGTGSGGNNSGSGGGGYLGAAAGARNSGRELAKELNAHEIARMIAIYRQTNSKLPATVADLEAPAQSTADRWGNQITFTFSESGGGGAGGTTKVLIRSNGPDGEPNTADDVVTTEDVPF